MSRPARAFALSALCCAVGAAAEPRVDLDADTRAGLRGLAVAGERVAWIGGTDGTLRRSTDAGATWSRLTVPGGEALDFRDIHAFDARRAVVIAPDEAAMRSLAETAPAFAPELEVLTFPAWDCLPYDRLRTGRTARLPRRPGLPRRATRPGLRRPARRAPAAAAQR